MKILVTGGAGFIGSHLCDSLLASGHRVVCVDNLLTGSRENLERAFAYGSRMVFKKTDVNRYEDLRSVFRSFKPDVVYHYAAVVGIKRTMESPFAVLEDIEGIKHVLDLSLKHKVRKVIYSSSSEVYGEASALPMREDSYPEPGLTYAAVKLIGERCCMAYFKKHNLKTCCLRFFNIYGPRQNATPYGFVAAIMIMRALQNRDIVIYGDGAQTRDFTYISDAVRSSVRALGESAAAGEIINIGTGVRTSIKFLAESIIRITGSRSKIRYMPERMHDILNRCARIDKMQDILACVPEYSLLEGLKNSVEWYASRYRGRVFTCYSGGNGRPRLVSPRLKSGKGAERRGIGRPLQPGL